MQFRHPFVSLSTSGQNWAFILFFILSILVMISLQVTGAPLRTDVSPNGIISFEFAGELDLAQRMVDSWGHTGRIYAGLNLGLDYLFLAVYACAISLGCVLVARKLYVRYAGLANVGIVLANAQFLAAILDCVENYGLIQVLLGTQTEAWPLVAKWCAWPKFLIVGAGLIYVIAGALWIAIRKENQ
ncbi:MAG: hypothetical protein JRF72_00615 [Deltaproteobacteria bacterium]|jgi:hypothetical protein|nr:hypothetical protein [Deltaproteobacteria bacterium]